MAQQVCIIGDGQMALVMADALSHANARVRLWGPLPADVRALSEARTSPRLPGFRLPAQVEVTVDDREAVAGAEYIISAIPTQYLRTVWRRLGPHVPVGACIVSVTKGIEIDTLKRPSEIICDCVKCEEARVCVLSGPSIAAELARRLPASLVAASSDHAIAQAVQELLNVPWLRIYSHDDAIGVEIAGATKNVIALAAGMVDGMKAGDNAKSALLARGLAEIARLGVAMGAKTDTFFGIAGVGDLATTCFSPEGRNRTCGERLGRGESLASILDSMTSVVEGVPTTQAVMQLAREHNVDMPITAAVYAILFEELTPRQAIRELMDRELKAEQVG